MGYEETGPWIIDKHFLAVHVQGKGIAIFTGFFHAGVVNICRHAQEVFLGVPLYALVGGLHLVYPNEGIIPETIAELATFGLRVIIPGRCTGFAPPSTALIEAFGEEIVDPLAVGSRQTLSRRPLRNPQRSDSAGCRHASS